MKRRIIVRLFPFNRLTFPLLLNVWEEHRLDREFEILATGADTRAAGPHAPPLHRETGPFRPGDVLLYSFMTPHAARIAAEVEPIVAARRAMRAGFPLLVAGGPHVSGDAGLPARLGFDVLVRGPGEEAFRRLGEELAGGGAVAGEGPPRVVDARPGGNAAPPPEAWHRYLPVSGYLRTFPPLEIMRGCRWRCGYCQTGGGRPRFRPQESIARWMAEMRRREVERVNFISPSSLEFGGEPALEELLGSAREAGFRFVEYGIFPSEVRPGTLSEENAALLRRLVSNRRLTIGAQSGLDDRLRAIRRGHSCADVERAVEIANAAGFRVNLDFIHALPGETEAETAAGVAFIRRLHRRHRVNVHLHHFFPLAGSALGRRWPARLNARQRLLLLDLHRQGIGNDWWLEGERQAAGFRSWMETRFPDLAERFSP